MLSSDLRWSPHIDTICTKARKLLYRRFYGMSDLNSLLEIYRTQVRPHLEYAAQVWDPHLQKDIKHLESVQKFALKMSTKLWDGNYAELLDITGIPTLQSRRSYLKMRCLHNILQGRLILPSNVDVLTPKPYRDEPPPGQLFREPLARTVAFQNSFIPSSIHLWNKFLKTGGF